MPAVGVTAKLPSPLDGAELQPSMEGHAPPAPPDRAEVPPPPDRHAPPPPPHHHGPPSLPNRDPAWETLRSVESVAAAWAAQDAELDAEIAALEAAGALTAPAEEEPGPDFDPGN